MERVSKYIFRVESDSDYNKKYVVDLDPAGEADCTCVAYAMRRNKGKKVLVSDRPELTYFWLDGGRRGLERSQYGWCKHLDRAIRGYTDNMEITTNATQAEEQFEFLQARLRLEQTLKELND